MENNNVTYIPNRLKNAAKGGYVAGAEDIIDDALNKDQSTINQERLSEVAKLGEDIAKEVAERRANDDILNIRVDAEAEIREHNDNLLNSEINTKQLEIGAVETDIEPTPGSVNMLPSGAIAFNLGYYIGNDNPEWVYVITDASHRLLAGIRKDGSVEWSAGIPKPVKAYIDNHVSPITEALSQKVDKEEGKGIIPTQYAEEITNQEWVRVILDSEQKVLYGVDKYGRFHANYFGIEPIVEKTFNELIKNDNFAFNSIVIVDNPEYISVWLDADGKLLGGIKTDGSWVWNIGESENSEFTIEFDKSVGFLNAQNSVVSAQESLAMTSEESACDDRIATDTVKPRKKPETRRIVAVHYDDMPKADYTSTRPLLNKYGFRASFAYIFQPFESEEEKSCAARNIRKMVEDGNSILLHSIGNCTYLFTDPLYDIRPDGKSNFIPAYSELQPIGDTGYNSLGWPVGPTTRYSDIGFVNSYADRTVVGSTEREYYYVWIDYVFWQDPFVLGKSVAGLDLDNNVVDKYGIFEWCEYFYNNLIDNTLGYSTYQGTVAQRFAADYSVPEDAVLAEYYPDATHLKKGKTIIYTEIGETERYTWYAWKHGSDVVFTLSDNPSVGDTIYNDTDLTPTGYTVASHSGSSITDNQGTPMSYERFEWSDSVNHLDAEGNQSVGFFTRGLYKGCSSTMNIEIIDKVILSAIAYFKHLTGYSKFDGYTPHGSRYSTALYIHDDDKRYFDRSGEFFGFSSTKIYNTRLKCFRSLYDIFENLGFKTIVNEIHRWNQIEGLASLYEGQENIRKTHLFSHRIPYFLGATTFPNLYKNDDMTLNTSYKEVMDVMGSVSNYGKFLLENANNRVIGKSGTEYTISGWFKYNIQRIIEALGTGRIPQLTFDTINDSSGGKFVMEQLYAFCYNNDIDIVSYDDARVMAINTPKPFKTNYFPNPAFRQTVRDYYGIESNEMNVPDGFLLVDAVSGCMIDVDDTTIGSKNVRRLATRGCDLVTRIYGLQPGNYRYSFKLKKDGNGNCSVFVEPRYNKDQYSYYHVRTVEGMSVNATTDWETYNIEFSINEPVIKKDDSIESLMCDGYQENICSVLFEFVSANDSIMYLAEPKITIV